MGEQGLLDTREEWVMLPCSLLPPVIVLDSFRSPGVRPDSLTNYEAHESQRSALASKSPFSPR